MKRRRRNEPDNRPDWRDPSMPVLMQCTDSVTGQPYLREYTPERITYAFGKRMEMGQALTYRDDPTYNLRRRRS